MLRTLTFSFATIVALCTSLTAKADFLPGFVGNSQFVASLGLNSNPQNADGVVNFAVYENTSPNWEVALGLANAANGGVIANEIPLNLPQLGIGTTNPTARYVYFYQIVNTNPLTTGESTLDNLQIPAGTFSTGGYLTSLAGVPLVFNETGVGPGTGPTGGAANRAIGAPANDVPGNGAPGFAGGSLGIPPGLFTLNPFAADPLSRVPLSLEYVTGPPNTYEFTFNPNINSVSGGGVGAPYSTILYLTSNYAPSYLVGQLLDGGTAIADIPSNTPEPSTLVALAGALLCGGAALVFNSAKKRN